MLNFSIKSFLPWIKDMALLVQKHVMEKGAEVIISDDGRSMIRKQVDIPENVNIVCKFMLR